MRPFDAPVRAYMSPATRTVGPDTRLPEVDRLLGEAEFSGLPVVDARGRPLGVITRTDLLRAGAIAAVTGTLRSMLVVPDRRVGDVVRGRPLCVPDDARLEDAARLMRDERVHRVLVVSDERLVGVVTTWDVVRVVAEARVPLPIGRMMSSPVVTVAPSLATGAALAKLDDSHVHALVVVESGWPIGVFTQREALLAERWPSRTKVESWLDASILTLPPSFPAFRAAAQALVTGARTIAVMDLEGVCGIVTPTNFLYATAESPPGPSDSPGKAPSRPPPREKARKPNERRTAPAMPIARRKHAPGR